MDQDCHLLQRQGRTNTDQLNVMADCPASGNQSHEFSH